MKFLAVFAAILAVAFGQSQWTLDQLSEALESPHTNPSLLPILEQALNSYMQAMFAGQSHEHITISTAPVDLSTWNLHELSEAVENPNTNPAILPYLENALNTLMNAVFAGEVPVAAAIVSIEIPALDISYWTMADLEQALYNPTTNPAMIPYLEQAVNQMMKNLFSGEIQTHIVLAIPATITKPVAVVPEVVVEPEVVVDPVQVVDEAVVIPDIVVNPIPVDPVAPPTPVVSGSPLVQIILNINQQSVTPEAVIVPAPVDDSEAFPNPRPPAPVNPRPPVPVIVLPDVVLPSPEVNPIDVIAVNPEPANPIEVIAVSPPEINPIDMLHPVLVPVAVVDGGDFGPM